MRENGGSAPGLHGVGGRIGLDHSQGVCRDLRRLALAAPRLLALPSDDLRPPCRTTGFGDAHLLAGLRCFDEVRRCDVDLGHQRKGRVRALVRTLRQAAARQREETKNEAEDVSLRHHVLQCREALGLITAATDFPSRYFGFR